MRTIFVAAILVLAVAGCSKTSPSPVTQTQKLPSNRFPPGMAPTAPKKAQ